MQDNHHHEPRAQAFSCAFDMQRVGQAMALLQDHVPIRRRLVREGDVVCQVGQPFGCLYVVNSGFFKLVSLSSDGRRQVLGLHFKGDWMGLEGISQGHYGCDVVAMDTGEVWAVSYEALLRAGAQEPTLLVALHDAMSRELQRERDGLMALCTMPADARVAGFLRLWADSLQARGLRTDQFTLRMTRAEIGNYLGMTLESVSRALSRLARGDVIAFADKARRDIQIPRIDALSHFIQSECMPGQLAVAC